MKIRPILGDYEMAGIQRIGVAEHRDLAEMAVPGLRGNYIQDMGSRPAHIVIEGTLHGDEARDGFLEALREKFIDGEPLAFIADITTATEVEEVVIRDLTVEERAGQADSFAYSIILSQYVEPPETAADSAVDSAIADEAEQLMEVSDIPELLSAPGFGDPTPPLQTTLDSVKGALSDIENLGPAIESLFGS